jgi:hypothetical protein
MTPEQEQELQAHVQKGTSKNRGRQKQTSPKQYRSTPPHAKAN